MLNDEASKIILNTKGIMKDLSEELLEFLQYVETSTDDVVKNSKGKLVSNIHKRVKEVKNDNSVEVHILKRCEAQSRTYMTLLERDREKIEEGRIEILKETILDNLRELGNVQQNLIDCINEQNNIDILKVWTRIAVIAENFDEFQEKIK